MLFCKILIASLATLKLPLMPFLVTNLKSSSDVYDILSYSLYFVLKIDVIGKSIPGELYCLSSEPLSKE